MIISRWIIFGMRNVSDMRCGENKNTGLVFGIFFKSCHFFLDNVENCGSDRQQMTLRFGAEKN